MGRVFTCLIMMCVTVLCLHAKGQVNLDGIGVDVFSLSKNFTVMIRSDFDMLLPIDQYKRLRISNRKTFSGRAGLGSSRTYWPYGIVQYEITDGLEPYRTLFKLAINHWEAVTCLKFNESTSALYHVRFVAARDCTSPHEFQSGVMEVGVHPSCLTVRHIIHEIGHAVGMIHEHNRPDRDDYIKLHVDKIPPRMRLYFDKYNRWDLNRNINVGYDYASIMHLADYGGILDTEDPMYQDRIGKGQSLSFRNIKHVDYMYQCNVVAMCQRRSCPFNGFVFSNPFRGQPKCQCVCDSGLLNDPLRLCSTLFSEFPSPAPFSSRIQASYLSDIPVKAACSDLQSNCAELKNQGLCRIQVETMFTECAKTCGFCNKGHDLCIDYDNGCHMMATSGACDDAILNETMRTVCPKSCGRCANTNSPCDIEHAMVEPATSGHPLTSATIFSMVITAATCFF